MLAHALEKGLVLKPRREWFGRDKIHDLIRHCQIYRAQVGDDWAVAVATHVLRSYLAEHEQCSHVDYSIRDRVVEFLANSGKFSDDVYGGLKPMPSTLKVPSSAALGGFFSRDPVSVHSMRGQSSDLSSMKL